MNMNNLPNVPSESVMSIENIKKFVEDHPDNSICSPWNEMLNDYEGEDHPIDDFLTELEYQIMDCNMSYGEIEELTRTFPQLREMTVGSFYHNLPDYGGSEDY